MQQPRQQFFFNQPSQHVMRYHNQQPFTNFTPNNAFAAPRLPHQQFDEFGNRLQTECTFNKKWMQIILAEFLGTATMMFVGCIGPDDMKIYTFGFAIMIAVQVFGPISGAHINPAITIAAIIMEEINVRLLPIYIIPQFLGALAGYAILQGTIPLETTGLCLTIVNDSISSLGAIIIELLSTFLITFCTCSLWDKRSRNASNASIKMGFMIMGLILATSTYTGASFNIARTLAPSLIQNKWDKHWIYWVGPNLGGLIAALVYKFLLLKREWQD